MSSNLATCGCRRATPAIERVVRVRAFVAWDYLGGTGNAFEIELKSAASIEPIAQWIVKRCTRPRLRGVSDTFSAELSGWDD